MHHHGTTTIIVAVIIIIPVSSIVVDLLWVYKTDLSILYTFLSVFFGHARAQVVSCRPFTVAAHFCAWVSYVRILVDEVPHGQVFLSFPHQYDSIATLNIHI
jgi:hypothetical protein